MKTPPQWHNFAFLTDTLPGQGNTGEGGLLYELCPASAIDSA